MACLTGDKGVIKMIVSHLMYNRAGLNLTEPHVCDETLSLHSTTLLLLPRSL